MEVAARIRASVGHTVFSAEGERVSSTISTGIARFSPDAEQQEEIMVRADHKLYESKRKGKNRVSH